MSGRATDSLDSSILSITQLKDTEHLCLGVLVIIPCWTAEWQHVYSKSVLLQPSICGADFKYTGGCKDEHSSWARAHVELRGIQTRSELGDLAERQKIMGNSVCQVKKKKSTDKRKQHCFLSRLPSFPINLSSACWGTKISALLPTACCLYIPAHYREAVCSCALK